MSPPEVLALTADLVQDSSWQIARGSTKFWSRKCPPPCLNLNTWCKWNICKILILQGFHLAGGKQIYPVGIYLEEAIENLHWIYCNQDCCLGHSKPLATSMKAVWIGRKCRRKSKGYRFAEGSLALCTHTEHLCSMLAGSSSKLYKYMHTNIDAYACVRVCLKRFYAILLGQLSKVILCLPSYH